MEYYRFRYSWQRVSSQQYEGWIHLFKVSSHADIKGILVNLFREERAANLARQEAINARLDALTKDLANSKADYESTENISHKQ
ncbi:hypothetical protein HAX54_007953, partial [Datura stramonium]|nr:hypothetical protein [Datura stramonium]